MAITTGTVQYIKVFQPGAAGGTNCLFGLLPAGGMTEELILWTSPPPITAQDWILNSAILLILRDAYASQTPVTVTTDDNSALVTQVQLGQS
jgi:hypothetical protein